jgi:hypothetical protein
MLQWRPAGGNSYKAIGSQLTFEATSSHWEVYVMVNAHKFTGGGADVSSLDEAKTACQAYFNQFYGIHDDAHPQPAAFQPTLPHRTTPPPGVNIADSAYRMGRIDQWRRAEKLWAMMLSARINAPKPNEQYYLNDPGYDWFVDYGVSPDFNPSRPI